MKPPVALATDPAGIFSWRDPDMPVLRDYLMADGSKKTLIDPDYEQRYRTYLLNSTAMPDWRRDPTYNLRKPK